MFKVKNSTNHLKPCEYGICFELSGKYWDLHSSAYQLHVKMVHTKPEANIHSVFGGKSNE